MYNKEPTLSVVMSVYNGSKYLHSSINSILNQTFSDFEFIIIDDCSTDNTLEILKYYEAKDKRIKIYSSVKNVGIKGFINNLNFGISVSLGKYIARMDHDDISNKYRFEKQLNILEEQPNVFLVTTEVNFINEKGGLINRSYLSNYNEKLVKKMLKENILVHPTFMYRKLNNYEYYRNKMLYCEDYDFILRVLSDKKDVVILNEVLLNYRILSTSMSKNTTIKLPKRLIAAMSILFYKQRISNGMDNYNDFDENKYLKLDTNDLTKLDLKFIIIITIKYLNLDLTNKFIAIYVNKYGKDFFIIEKRLLLKLPYVFIQFYSKFYANYNKVF